MIEDYPEAGIRFLAQLKVRYTMFAAKMSSHNDFIMKKGDQLLVESLGSGSGTEAGAEARSGFIKRHSSKSLPEEDHLMNLKSKSHNLWIDGDLCHLDTPELKHLKVLSFQSDDKSEVLYSILRNGIDDDGKKCHQIIEVSLEALGEYHVIFPTGRIKIFWDSFIGILIIYSCITLPLQVAFESYTHDIQGFYVFVFDYVVDCFFFIDIVLNFNTAYFSTVHDSYITVKKMIAYRYMSTYFLIDLIGTVPIDKIVDSLIENNNLAALRLIKVFRLLRLVKLVKLLDAGYLTIWVDEFRGANAATVMIFFTVMKVLVLSHFVACLFWGLSAQIHKDAWFDHVFNDVSIRNAGFLVQYVASLYWSVTTLTTTGYGDILPGNTEERIIVNLLLLLGVSVFGYVTSNVVMIMGYTGIKEARIRKMNILLREFVSGSDLVINRKLLSDINTHMKEELRHRSAFDEDLILYRLPLHIKNELVFNQNSSAFENIILFRFIENISVKLAIFSVMQVGFADTGKKIVREGGQGKGIIFLEVGRAIITQQVLRHPGNVKNNVLPRNKKVGRDIFARDPDEELKEVNI